MSSSLKELNDLHLPSAIRQELQEAIDTHKAANEEYHKLLQDHTFWSLLDTKLYENTVKRREAGQRLSLVQHQCTFWQQLAEFFRGTCRHVSCTLNNEPSHASCKLCFGPLNREPRTSILLGRNENNFQVSFLAVNDATLQQQEKVEGLCGKCVKRVQDAVLEWNQHLDTLLQYLTDALGNVKDAARSILPYLYARKYQDSIPIDCHVAKTSIN